MSGIKRGIVTIFVKTEIPSAVPERNTEDQASSVLLVLYEKQTNAKAALTNRILLSSVRIISDCKSKPELSMQHVAVKNPINGVDVSQKAPNPSKIEASSAMPILIIRPL